MNKFKWVTQAFSQPFEIQKNLFPEFLNAAEQLSVEWEVALGEMDDSRLANIQRQMIKELDDYILSISGVDNLKYWSDRCTLSQSGMGKNESPGKSYPECNGMGSLDPA